jgi:hypothetical protein
MAKHSHRPLTRSYSRAHGSFGSVQLQPRSRLARRTLSADSEQSQGGFSEVDVRLDFLVVLASHYPNFIFPSQIQMYLQQLPKTS